MDKLTIAGWVCFGEDGGNVLMVSRDVNVVVREMRATCEGDFSGLHLGWIHEEAEFDAVLAAFNAPRRSRPVYLDDVLDCRTRVRDVESFAEMFRDERDERTDRDDY